MIWFPEACALCYELSSILLNDEADEDSLRAAKTSLRSWVSGFGRNAPPGCPYLLDLYMASRLFPASSSAAVPPEQAAPIIESIRAALPVEEEHLLSGDISSLDIPTEPMDEQVSGVDLAETFLSPTPSSSSSFHGFDKPQASPWEGSVSVRPKVKPIRKSKPKTNISASPQSISPIPGPSSAPDVPMLSRTPPRPKGQKGKSTKSKASALRSSSDSQLTLESIQDMVETKLQRHSGVIAELKDMVASLIRDESHPAPSPVPDASKLPPFDKNNPWRCALHAPYLDGTLTLEGLGTRRLEDLEFFPPGLQFPFNGFVRLREHALVRMDKVPKETVIFPKEQAQAVWARTLAEWGCRNSKQTPHKGAYTIFITPPSIPSPLTDKIAELTIQSVKDGIPMLSLKETDPTSLLVPDTSALWNKASSTFTVGKLDPDCASSLFSERLPKITDHLLKVEFESRNRLARTLNSVVSSELIASLYSDEPLFRVQAKNLLQSFQSDLQDFWTARTNCRKHVLAEASIRHEPNRLITSSGWGKTLFPQEEVDKVLQDAARANQNLQVRWGLSNKRKFENLPRQPFSKKKQRSYVPYKIARGHLHHSTSPHSSTPSTSKALWRDVARTTPTP
ncbi:uncharacterized protein [Palaemon carinicauda]|uniref:uncharacterized protein n=1 Tax=Palaemon carinicauda TaxID=392227 RepID=UPI0035B648E2